MSEVPLPAGPYDPIVPQHHLDPYDRLAEARSQCPVARLPGGRAYVAGHRENLQALADDRNLSCRSNFLLERLPDEVPAFVTQTDPPEHTALRRALRTLFLRSNVAAQRPMMRRTARQLLDVAEVPARTSGDLRMDMMAFGRAYSAAVLWEVIGVPAEDRAALGRLAAEAITLFPGPYWDSPVYEEFSQYAFTLIERRRQQSADDFVGLLLATGVLTDEQIRSHLLQLVVAGYESTATLIANLCHQLLEEPARWQRLVTDRSAVPAAVNESLRHRTPIAWVTRTARDDAPLGDVTVPGGDLVLLGLESANRDETVFPDPARFDPSRENHSRHLAFGSGIHRCLGDTLATAEAEEALGELLDRYPDLRLDGDEAYQPNTNPVFRAPVKVRVRLSPRVDPAPADAVTR